jgi:signal recognition particle subunit SEC65
MAITKKLNDLILWLIKFDAICIPPLSRNVPKLLYVKHIKLYNINDIHYHKITIYVKVT